MGLKGRRRARSAFASRRAYSVRGSDSVALPPVLIKLFDWLAGQARGSVGWFAGVTVAPASGAWGRALPTPLRNDAVAFITLGDGDRICVLDGHDHHPVVRVGPVGDCQLVSPDLASFLFDWTDCQTGVTELDHDGSQVVVQHDAQSATARSVPSARGAMRAWLKAQGIKRIESSTLSLPDYLPNALADVEGASDRIPRNLEHEASIVAGSREGVAKFGVWLHKQGHPLGEVIAADVAAEAEAAPKRAARNYARKVFEAYVKAHFASRYSRIAGNMVHFTNPVFPRGMGFRYGLLQELDTFDWSPSMCNQVVEFLADDHSNWITDLTLRNVQLSDLELVARFVALRKLNFRWTDIERVRSVAPLAKMHRLRALNVSKSSVVDLSPLRSLPIVQLYLENTPVADLGPLADHPTLECIELDDSRVTDVRPLLSCPRLCRVGLWDTSVPKTQLDELMHAIKNNGAEPLEDQRGLMSGYDKYLSHADVDWY